MKKNSSNLYAFAIQDQLSNGLTGQTPTIHISKDGGSFAVATNSAAEFNASTAPGLYTITFTATECDCDVMIIQVYLPNGQEPAILDVIEMQSASGGGATPQQIWEYAGGRTVDNTIPSVNDIWGRQAGDTTSRTITNTIPTASDNATAVWGAQDKVVTIDSTQAATLAAASDLDSVATKVELIKAKTDNLPAEPAAKSDIPSVQSIQSGLATSDALSTVDSVVDAIKAKTDNLPQTPAAVGSEMALTSAAISAVQNGLATGLNIESAVGALELYGDTNWSTANVSGLATTAGLESLATYGDNHWSTADVSGLAEKTDIPTDYAKPTDIPTSDITAIKTKVDSLHNTDLTGVATALSVEKIHAGLFNWSLDEDVINAKNPSGTVIVSSAITRDSSGNITAMEEDND